MQASGVANWDQIVRRGGRDVGVPPPTALGVEAAGIVTAMRAAVHDGLPVTPVLTHPLPAARRRRVSAAASCAARAAGPEARALAAVLSGTGGEPVTLTFRETSRESVCVEPASIVGSDAPW